MSPKQNPLAPHAAAPSASAGFTLTELIVSSTVLTAVVAISLGAYTTIIREGREGTLHARYIDGARSTEQNIVKFVQAGKAVSANASALDIMKPDSGYARIQYVDGDGDADTLEDNALEYDPDTGVGGDEVMLCNFVTAIPGEPMFQILATSPRTALCTFHVGEVPKAGEQLLYGMGYQGVEIRVAATPRNLGSIYKN